MALDEALERLREVALRQQAQALLHRRGGTPEEKFEVGSERIDGFEALGRVLAQDLVSPLHVPPLDNSAMDGYALRVADLPGAGHSLPQSQRIMAGRPGRALAPGTCARIFTGAAVPPGADAVVMQEQTSVPATPGPDPAGLPQVRFDVQPVLGQNIRRQGEDVRQGDTVLAQGLRLSPAALGVAASVGAAHLWVHPRPRVALLSSGDELFMPGEPLPVGAIYNANRHTLRGLIQACGAECVDLGTVPDELDATRRVLREASGCDLVISSGGVSVGDADHLRAAVQAEGELDLWQLAIKPGKPFVLGRLNRSGAAGQALYMGLPGNPVASWVTFLMLVRPVLGVLSGEPWREAQAMLLPADFDWPHPDRRREFLRARRLPQGGVALYPHQGSGVLSSAAWSDGLVDVRPGQPIAKGELVRFLPLSECLQPSSSLCQGTP